MMMNAIATKIDSIVLSASSGSHDGIDTGLCTKTKDFHHDIQNAGCGSSRTDDNNETNYVIKERTVVDVNDSMSYISSSHITDEHQREDRTTETSTNQRSCHEQAYRSSLNVKRADRNEITNVVSRQRNESKAVVQLKLTVLAILVVSAITVGGVTFWYLRHSEQVKFNDIYNDDATKLAQSLYGAVLNTLASLDLLTTVMVAHADTNNDTFPFVTLPRFANHAAKTLSLSASISLWTYFLVQPIERQQWEEYAWSNRYIVNETLDVMDIDPNYYGTIPWDVPLKYSIHSDYSDLPYTESRQFAPVWQLYPLQSDGFTAFNWDFLSDEDPDPFVQTINEKHAVIGEPYILPDPDIPQDVSDAEYWANAYAGSVSPGDNPMEPCSDLIYPIINKHDARQLMDNNNTINSNLTVVGAIAATLYWRDLMKNILPTGKQGLVVVVENPCTAPFTYEINGPRTNYLGRGDLHDPKYDKMMIQSSFFKLYEFNTVQSKYTGIPINENYCTFNISFYPSTNMEEQFTSKNPAIFASVAVLIFLFTSVVFVIYDIKVERRQQSLASTAERSNAVLSSLFPTNIRDKLLQEENDNGYKDNTWSILRQGSKPQLTGNTMIKYPSSQPIADLYSDTTVCFADICGFTAWSSTRGPDQVFILLEALYGEFDIVARHRRVFKVETIGDSYVSVAGLPNSMKYHAQVMVKFAEDILHKMRTTTTSLSSTLGPDTGELQMRIGLNSGPTTAGVIRGEKSRFQLFGDTVNTAARMESTGKSGRIQCTHKTADLIREAGKGHWLCKRKDIINVKGKGSMDTYWVQTTRSKSIYTNSFNDICGDLDTENGESISGGLDVTLSTQQFESKRRQHLIEWHTDLFLGLLSEISISRSLLVDSKETLKYSQTTVTNDESSDSHSDGTNRLPLHEVVETIAMPKFRLDDNPSRNGKKEQIDPVTVKQLGEYITTISTMYQTNPFHNFEHASHVVMSTKNLLDRMVVPLIEKSDNSSNNNIGIDPLARFSIVFGALIHDVDHQGVSNFQLVTEQSPIAIKYDNRCVAEQNSFELSWRLLMQPHYDKLRQAIFVDDEEYDRFRQIVINVVMATDIFDTELKNLRDKRWENVFGQQEATNGNPNLIDTNNNRRRTIFIEHLIQTSDVIHTMQHWNVYQKWNHRLFREMYIAYSEGRSGMNPSKNWYEGEMKFFDNYIIPLAKKLKACTVFGTNCDAFLDFANDNRLEWESKGQRIVAEWIRQLDSCDDDQN